MRPSPNGVIYVRAVALTDARGRVVEDEQIMVQTGPHEAVQFEFLSLSDDERAAIRKQARTLSATGSLSSAAA